MANSPDRLKLALQDRYAIIREIGAGGMATVYLADDIKHQRKVAVKVLRPDLAASLGPERFLREVTVAANLQHPHILMLIDSGETDGFLYYVMPFIEGTSLRQKLAREGELPIAEAVRILRDIADAMAYAHEHGVVHRDIKPENVMLSGRHALVMDFGVAKAVNEATGRQSLTTVGVALGTPTYMAPEQAAADPHTDHRADLYAFGVVAYELLTGRPPFTGPTPQSVLAAHVTMAAEAVSVHRASIPAPLAALVMKCLEKKPADRWQSANELIPQLEAVLTPSGGTTPTATEPVAAVGDSSLAHRRTRLEPAVQPHGPIRGPSPRTRLLIAEDGTPRWLRLALSFIAVAAIGAAAGAGLARRSDPPARGMTVRITIPTTGPQLDRLLGQLPLLALSPDGSVLVFSRDDKLYLQRIESFEATMLAGSENATVPAFSPDGNWIVFGQAGRLRKVAVSGGPVTDIASATPYRLGAFWSDDDNIYYSAGLGDRGIWRVRASGGQPEPVTTLVDSLGEQAHGWPQVLPGGRDLLYTILGASASAGDSRIVVERIGSHQRTTLVEHATFGRYIKSGFLLYGTMNGAVYAVPYDVSHHRLSGTAVAVLDAVTVAVWGGGMLFTSSDGGTLAYVVGSANELHAMHIVDRSGRSIRQLGPALNVRGAMFAPTGDNVAVTVRAPGTNDVWLFRTASEESERFTLTAAENEMPVWSPRGDLVAYRSAKSGGSHLLVAKGVGIQMEPRIFRTWARHIHLTSWSPDGKWLAAYDYHPVNNEDIWALAANGKDSLAIATSAARELNATFSPDAKWLAYQSDESGRFEIYVVSFPDLSAKRQVSTSGGTVPRWNRAGNELYYQDKGNLLAVSVSTVGGFARHGTPTPLFATTAFDYDVSPDGKQFLLEIPNPAAPTPPIRVIVNWVPEQRAAAGSQPH